MTETSPNLKKAFTLYALVYILALFVAIIFGLIFRKLSPVFIVLIADIAATLVIYWDGARISQCQFLRCLLEYCAAGNRFFLEFRGFPPSRLNSSPGDCVCFSYFWGFRLTWNWAHQWQGIKHEDWRYRDLREKNSRLFWLIELVGIDLMPTLIVFLACLPLYPALVAGKNALNPIDIIAFIVTAGAIVIEAVADRQLWQFTRQKTRSGEIMTRGFWAYSRHPNYFGEITVLVGYISLWTGGCPRLLVDRHRPGVGHGTICGRQCSPHG